MIRRPSVSLVYRGGSAQWTGEVLPMGTSIFNPYRAGENRVTASLLAVLERADAGLVEELLAAVTGESTLPFVNYVNQPSKGGKGVPDAEIAGSFRYLFEAKTEPGATKTSQLHQHLERLAGAHETERLFLVTPDPEEPSAVSKIDDERLVWFSFRALSQAIDALLGEEARHVTEQSRFLMRELQSMLDEDGLLDNDDVAIVAARNAWPEYEDYEAGGLRAYIRQPNRPFRKGTSHLGFYYEGHIQRVFPRIVATYLNIPIDPDAVEDHSQHSGYSEALRALFMQLLDAGARELGAPHGVFLLTAPSDDKTLEIDHPIANTNTDKHGAPTAWTQNQRYVSFASLEEQPATTGELDAMK